MVISVEFEKEETRVHRGRGSRRGITRACTRRLASLARVEAEPVIRTSSPVREA